MPKYMLVKELPAGWDYIQGYRDFYNTIEAAVDAARAVAIDCENIAVAEVVKRFTAEVSIKEVKVR